MLTVIAVDSTHTRKHGERRIDGGSMPLTLTYDNTVDPYLLRRVVGIHMLHLYIQC